MEGSPLQGKCLEWQHIRNDFVKSKIRLKIVKRSIIIGFCVFISYFFFFIFLFRLMIYQILQLVVIIARK